MVDTSGSSYCNSSSSSDDDNSIVGSKKNDTSRAYATKKKGKGKKTDVNDDLEQDYDVNDFTGTDSAVFDTMTDDYYENDDDDQKISSASLSSSSPSLLGPYDVICGRNKAAFNNVGNRRFRFTIALALPRFLNAKSRKDKSIVIVSIKKLVHQNGGKFLIMQNEDEETAATTNDDSEEIKVDAVWTELDPKQSHLKIGHALRDAERKLSKARKQEQTQRRQQQGEYRIQKQHDQKPQQSIVIPANRMNSTETTFRDLNYSDPPLQSDPFEFNTEWVGMDDYDVASMSSTSFPADVDGIDNSDAHSLAPPKSPPRQSLPPQPRTAFLRPDAIPLVTEHNPQQPQQSSQYNYFTTNVLRRRRLQSLLAQQQQRRFLQPGAPAMTSNHSLIAERQRRLLHPAQAHQPQMMSYNNNTNYSLTTNDIASHSIPTWAYNRRRNSTNTIHQPIMREEFVMSGNEENRFTSLGWDDQMVASALEHNFAQSQLNNDSNNNNSNGDHNRRIMSWLVDESDDVIDFNINNLGNF